MRISFSFLAVAAALASFSNAQLTTVRSKASPTSKFHAATSAPAVSSPAPSAVASPCAAISRGIKSYVSKYPQATDPPLFYQSLALNCLKSVPLDSNRSSTFIDYIKPYLQFQSSLAYLKDPPKGYTVPGADIFGGLDKIRQNVVSGVYKDQWSFEVDLHSLINVLAHDFHFNLPMPLVDVFEFRTYRPLISVSTDGLSAPSVYLKDDLDEVAASSTKLSWEPSPITKINGEDVSTYLQKLSLQSSPFQDADAVYNQMFYSVPLDFASSGNLFDRGGHPYGFPDDTTSYTFANGTTESFYNVASPLIDFTGINDGNTLYQAVELDPTTDVDTLFSSKNAIRSLETLEMPETRKQKKRESSNPMPGYPKPRIAHSEGAYTAGFFLENTDTAVLVMTAFTSSNSSSETDQDEMQYVIEQFLLDCKKNGMKKLIVDVSGNGGGSVFSGYDAFKQLFPTIVPYGASRMRTTPLVDYFGNVFSAAGIYDKNHQPVYQIQSALDVNLKKYSSWADMGGPYQYYGDNFLGTTRANLTDPIMTGGFSVSGYLDKANVAPAVFDASNIVVLYDGGCGSTCAIFSEFMKMQGGVRSIAIGGRPQTGPMQGVGGSKGAQVLKFVNVEIYRGLLEDSVSVLTKNNIALPKDPPAEYIPPSLNTPTPLGSKAGLLTKARFNLRNNIRDGDNTQTPLQFVYEATNCRLFYKSLDYYDYSQVWTRVAGVTWGKDKCVAGSTVNSDNSMGTKATDTVAWSDSVNSKVTLPAQPGLVPVGSNPGTGGSSTGGSGTSSGDKPADKKNDANGFKGGFLGLVAALAATILLI